MKFIKNHLYFIFFGILIVALVGSLGVLYFLMQPTVQEYDSNFAENRNTITTDIDDLTNTLNAMTEPDQASDVISKTEADTNEMEAKLNNEKVPKNAGKIKTDNEEFITNIKNLVTTAKTYQEIYSNDADTDMLSETLQTYNDQIDTLNATISKLEKNI